MRTSLILFPLLLALSIPAQAKVYLYVDTDGRKGATDKREAIPLGAKLTNIVEVPPEPELISRRKATNAEMSRCFEKRRVDFLDPRSAYPVTAQVLRYRTEYKDPSGDKAIVQYDTYVEVDVSARNKVGGSNRALVQCQIK